MIPAGYQGCAEDGACGAAHPGASLPAADLKFVFMLNAYAGKRLFFAFIIR